MGILSQRAAPTALRALRSLLLGVAIVSTCNLSQAAPTVRVAFSPDGDAEQVVLDTIQGARVRVRLAAYVLTSPRVVSALIEAKRKRGVDVQVVADAESNTTGDRSGKSRKALDLLKGAGIPVRLTSRYQIHHDKFCVVDDVTVQTGSFNYTVAAARSNSENVLVLFNRADVAGAYLRHWKTRYDGGQLY